MQKRGKVTTKKQNLTWQEDDEDTTKNMTRNMDKNMDKNELAQNKVRRRLKYTR